MIIQSLCNTCLQPYTLLVEPSDVNLVKEVCDDEGHTCPCPRLCGGRINLVGDPIISAMNKDKRLKDPITITGKQLYQAIHGLGLPNEIPKSLPIAKSLLINTTITDVDIEEKDGQFFLHEIKLANGSVIHLASGNRGAQILRISEENQLRGS